MQPEVFFFLLSALRGLNFSPPNEKNNLKHPGYLRLIFPVELSENQYDKLTIALYKTELTNIQVDRLRS